jgi:tetratricopeptide (TPR) repeat protein
MPGKNSWLTRARETSHGLLPARAAVRVQPPSTLSSYASDAEAPHPVSSRSHSLLWIAGGVLAAGAVVLLVTLTRTERVAKVEPQKTPSVEVVLPVLAPSSPRPAAEPAPVVPAVAATAQSPATATAGTPPEKAKRQPSGQPPSDTERSRKRVGAESMEAAQTAFSKGDFIAAGVQAKRAARYGLGVRAYLLLAESMMRLRSYQEAQQAYESVLALDPNNSVAKLGLNVCKRHTSP